MFAFVVVAVCGAVLPGEPARAATARDRLPVPKVTISATSVAAALRRGRSFDRSAVRIAGTLDLRALRVVSSAFRCRSCKIVGSLLAPDVTFREVVDLSGSTVTGPVDFQGAKFDRALAWRDGTVYGTARFGLAVFEAPVAFDDTTFASAADMSGADFGAAATFANTNFAKTASFAAALFSGTAIFTGGPSTGHKAPATSRCLTIDLGAFAAAAVFTNARFAGMADFRGRCFAGLAQFSDVVVDGMAAFDGAEFAGIADFERGQFGADVSFRRALFRGDATCTRPPLKFPPDCTKFTFVIVRHDLVFDYAQFQGATDLTGATIAGTLSFSNVLVGRVLRVDGLSTGGVVLDLRDISWLPVDAVGDEIDMLKRVEVTARSRGQTDIANNARFTWLSLSHDSNHNGITRFVDLVFYHYTAGYLVKPLYPVLALLLVIVVAIAIRVIARMYRRGRAPGRHKGQVPRPELAGSTEPGALAPGDPAGARQSANAGPQATAGHNGSPAESGQPGAPHETPRAGTTTEAPFIGVLLGAMQDTLAVVVPRLPKSNTARSREPVRPPEPDQQAVAGESPPAGQEAKTGRADGSYLAELMKLLEWIAVKALLVVFVLCVANANATLHQFIESLLNR